MSPGLTTIEDLVAALGALPDPVFVFKVVRDPQGSIVELAYAFLNESAARLSGRPVEEILGRGLLELYPSVRDQGLWDDYLGVIESGAPVTVGVPWLGERGQECYFRVTASRCRDGVVVSLIDITEQRRTERELTEASWRYQRLAENASDVVTMTDRDRRVTWVSPSVSRTLGWTPEELVGTRLSDLVHPDDKERTASVRDALYAGQEVTPPDNGFVMRIRSKSGDYRWISLTATPVTTESGALVGVVGGWRYVDELVHAQQTIRAERAMLRATVDSLLDPQVRYDTVRDDTGQVVDLEFVDANPAACAYFEMDYTDLIGSRLLDLFPGHVEAGLFEKYRQVVETGEPLAIDDFEYVQDLLNTERRYDIRAARVGDGLSVVWRDVTDRHAAALQLAESEEHYRLVAENVSDVAMAFSAGRRFEWVSGSVAHVMGWQPSDLVGRLIDEFVHPDDLAQHGQVIADASTVSAMNVEFRFRRRDGTYRWVACRTRLRVGEDGAPAVVAGGLVDIQERKEAEAQELSRLAELERFQRLTVGRELKMIELKKEIEYLRKYGPAGGSDLTARPEAEDPEAEQH